MSERWKISLCCRSSSFSKKKKEEKGAIRKFLGYFVQKYSKKKRKEEEKIKEKRQREKEKRKETKEHISSPRRSRRQRIKRFFSHTSFKIPRTFEERERVLLSNRGEGGLSSRFSSRPPRSLSPFPLPGSRSRAAAYRDRRTIVHGFRFYRGKTLPADLLVC